MNISIRAGQGFYDSIDRDDMFGYPSDDDIEVHIVAFADGHPPDELYVVNNSQDILSELDLTLLYSERELSHEAYPKPAKSKPTPYHPTPISLIAYHADETAESIFLDYPYTSETDLNAAIDKVVPDRLTLIKGVTGLPNDPNFVYHRCSSTVGSSGGYWLTNTEVSLV